MSVTFWPSCDTCTRCSEPGCCSTICLTEDPAALCDTCGWVTCEGCDHECELAEVPC